MYLHPFRAMTAAALAVLAVTLAACSVPSTGPYAPSGAAERDPAEAQRLTLRAAELMDSDPKEAEKILLQALTCDLYHGPAHNNLGVLYLRQGLFYQAAGEYEWARRLLPGLPEPRLNLALTLERAGRTDEALETYRTALEVYPGHIQTMQAIARLEIRTGKAGDSTREYLREIAMRGESASWREWAQQRLAFSP